jgi:hypothetical protein
VGQSHPNTFLDVYFGRLGILLYILQQPMPRYPYLFFPFFAVPAMPFPGMNWDRNSSGGAEPDAFNAFRKFFYET